MIRTPSSDEVPRGVPRRARRLLHLLRCSLLLPALGLLAGCVAEPEAQVAVGQPLPPFELPRLDGGELSSDELRGDGPVLINFWATWCGPCVKEIPALRQLHATGAARVVSISVDSDADPVVRDFVQEHGIDYDVLRGGIGLVTRYGSSSIPYTLVLDEDLTVRSLHRVAVSLRTLERDVAAAAR